MKQTITAIDNSEINQKLRNEDNIEIVSKDIIYKEGILEQIEKNKKIELIIMNEKIDGEISIKELIKKVKEKIKNIEIIIITENKSKIEEEISKFKKIKIYETNKIKIKKLIEIINSEKKYEPRKEEKRIITFTGSSGSGKTITTYIFSKINLNQESLIIDYNPSEKQDIATLLKIKEKGTIQKINKINVLITNKKENIKKAIKQFKEITIDLETPTPKEKEYILKESTKIILLLEANLLGIKKVKEIIKKYTEELKIEKRKILILINKKNKSSIDKKIIENIFKEIKIIGEIKNNEKYEKIINNNLIKVENILTKEEKENIKNITDKILENSSQKEKFTLNKKITSKN